MSNTATTTSLPSARQRALPKLLPHVASKNPVRASMVADVVLAELAEPDQFMLEAGMAELDRALPRAAKAYVRDLAGVVWRSMLARAR